MSRDADFRVRFGRDLEIAVRERPGRTLDARALGELVGELRQVAAREGKPLPAYGALAGDRADLADRIVTVIYLRTTGEPIAFSALRYLDLDVAGTAERVVHLGLVYIHPAHRRRGLSRLLYGLPTFLLFFRAGMRPYWVSSVTQVPTVFGLVAEHYDGKFPSHDPCARQTFGHFLRARAIMRDHRAAFGVGPEAGFDEARQIVTNAYTGGSDALKKSYADAPKHRNPAVNAFCRAALDYGRGDDFLQLGVWNLDSSLRLLRGLGPRSLTARLVFRAALLLAVSVLVPITRWLIPARRPRASAAAAARLEAGG